MEATKPGECASCDKLREELANAKADAARFRYATYTARDALNAPIELAEAIQGKTCTSCGREFGASGPACVLGESSLCELCNRGIR